MTPREILDLEQLTKLKTTMGIILSYDGDHTFRPWSTLKLLTISNGGKKLTMDFYDWLVEIEGESFTALLPLIQDHTLSELRAEAVCCGASVTRILETEKKD
jgi:hypothetical protein